MERLDGALGRRAERRPRILCVRAGGFPITWIKVVHVNDEEHREHTRGEDGAAARCARRGKVGDEVEKRRGRVRTRRGTEEVDVDVGEAEIDFLDLIRAMRELALSGVEER